MLPLVPTLLDTIKILMIGNSLTYFNQMPATFQNLMSENGKVVMIDSIFKPGMNPECLFITALYPDIEICSDEIITTHKVWDRNNVKYKSFSDIFKGYGFIYIQPKELDYVILYEILQSVDRSMDKDAIIILFQNYKNIIWNEDVRRKELDKEYAYFKAANKSKKVALLPIGDLFDLMMKDDSAAGLLDNSNHPTKAGSDIIAAQLAELVLYYSQ